VSNKSLSSDPGFFGELWQQAKLVLQLFLDPKVPIYLKVLPIAALAYLLFPFDFLPDVVPGLGQLDDLTILLIGAKVFIEMAPKDVVDKYLGRLNEGSVGKADAGDAEGSDIVEGIIIDDGDGEEEIE
jgi:uncharacterized membrane protein YkvA (DUF1232 family)